VLFGAWQAPAWHTKIGAATVSWPVLLALWGGAVIGAVYMLRAMRNICFGPTPAKWQTLVDANIFARVPYVLLLGVLIWVGCYPKPFVEAIKPATGQIITAIEKAVPAVAPKR